MSLVLLVALCSPIGCYRLNVVFCLEVFSLLQEMALLFHSGIIYQLLVVVFGLLVLVPWVCLVCIHLIISVPVLLSLSI